jgi:hypothetical protein
MTAILFLSFLLWTHWATWYLVLFRVQAVFESNYSRRLQGQGAAVPRKCLSLRFFQLFCGGRKILKNGLKDLKFDGESIGATFNFVTPLSQKLRGLQMFAAFFTFSLVSPILETCCEKTVASTSPGEILSFGKMHTSQPTKLLNRFSVRITPVNILFLPVNLILVVSSELHVVERGHRNCFIIEMSKLLEYCDPCDCKFAPEDYPTSSPELNPAENAQNQLRQVVRKMCHTGEVK